MSILLFLHRLVEVFTEYFRELEEESLRDNFVVVYELLDEMVDFGHPQTTEKNILKEYPSSRPYCCQLTHHRPPTRYITQQSFQLDTGPARPPSAITNAVSWRSEGIKYRKNEVFLDVVESLNLLVNANGSVVQSEILGAVKVRCYLSGMPELRLGLNDRVIFEQAGRTGRTNKAVDLEDVKFHQCVRLAKFDADRTICFIPPDGDFELMSYRMTPSAMKPPIWVECVIEHWSASRIEYLIKARSQLKKKTNANNVEIVIPVPEDADTPRFKVSNCCPDAVPASPCVMFRLPLEWPPTKPIGGPSFGRLATFPVARNSPCEPDSAFPASKPVSPARQSPAAR